MNTLTHRALMVCSKELLSSELTKIKEIFIANGYPSGLVTSTIETKVESFREDRSPMFGPHKCPVYLRLPYIGHLSAMYRKKINDAIRRCYFSVNPRIITTSKPILPPSTKDVLPTTQRSDLIYLFTCCCDSKYVGRTSQRLESRIRQHVPLNIKKLLGNTSSKSLSHSSAIAEHLLNSVECGKRYNDDMFQIIGRGKSKFHLQVLEALHIINKKPVLCRQKQFVYSTLLFKT